jgi:capsular polysaccharide biosynthesis protein
MEFQKNEFEIDLLELLSYLKKKLLFIVLAVMLGGLLSAMYTNFFTTPYYTATTRMYVLNRASDKVISSSDISVSNYMVKDYKVLITGKNVTQEVVDQLGLNMSAGQVAGKVSVSAIDNTRVLQINVVDTDPQRAADIANAVREVSSRQIKAIMDVDAVNLVFEAEAPAYPSGPNGSRNTALGAILAGVLAVGFFIVIFLLDDTLRTEEDVERYLGLGTLGVIPISKELGTEAASKKFGLPKLGINPPKKAKK